MVLKQIHLQPNKSLGGSLLGKRIKVQLDIDVANSLIRLKEVGDTYSDVVRRLLKK